MITGTSSGISPSSKCRTREQVRQTNSKSWVTMKMTFPISDKRRISPSHLGHAVKVQAAGRFIEYQQVFPADHADGYGHPLFSARRKGY